MTEKNKGCPKQRLLALQARESQKKNDVNSFVKPTIEVSDLLPSSKYVTFLARMPLFIPTSKRREYAADVETGFVIETPWGRIRRFGPGLDVGDEDVFLALMRLCRQSAITGPMDLLPKGSDNISLLPTAATKKALDSQVVTVHMGMSTCYAINQYLHRGNGGKEYKRTLDSIKRLSRVTLEIEKGDPGSGNFLATNLFSVIGTSDGEESTQIRVQFSPAIVQMLDYRFTYIDWEIRRQLTPLGKALHRFLSTHLNRNRRDYSIRCVKLKEYLGYPGTESDLRRELRRRDLPKLKELGWLQDWGITGTGRSTPYVLYVKKTQQKPVSVKF